MSQPALTSQHVADTPIEHPETAPSQMMLPMLIPLEQRLRSQRQTMPVRLGWMWFLSAKYPKPVWQYAYSTAFFKPVVFNAETLTTLGWEAYSKSGKIWPSRLKTETSFRWGHHHLPAGWSPHEPDLPRGFWVGHHLGQVGQNWPAQWLRIIQLEQRWLLVGCHRQPAQQVKALLLINSLRWHFNVIWFKLR